MAPTVPTLAATALSLVALACNGGQVDDAPPAPVVRVEAEPALPAPDPAGDGTEDAAATQARCWDTSKAPPKTFKDREIHEKGSHHPHVQIVFGGVDGLEGNYPLLTLRASCGGHGGLGGRGEEVANNLNLAFNSLSLGWSQGRVPDIQVKHDGDRSSLFVEVQGNNLKLLEVCNGDVGAYRNTVAKTELEFKAKPSISTRQLADYWAALIEDLVNLFYFCENPTNLVSAGMHEAKYMQGLLTVAERHAADTEATISLDTFREIIDQGLYPRSNLKTLEDLAGFVPASFE